MKLQLEPMLHVQALPENQNFVSPCFKLPYIYCLRLSEASSFRKKKLNMGNKLVMLRLAQIK